MQSPGSPLSPPSTSPSKAMAETEDVDVVLPPSTLTTIATEELQQVENQQNVVLPGKPVVQKTGGGAGESPTKKVTAASSPASSPSKPKPLRVEEKKTEQKENATPPTPTAAVVTNPSTTTTTTPSTTDVPGQTDQEAKFIQIEEHHETEEVIERLLDVKGLNQSVSGLWGWMSGEVAKVAENAKQVAEKASQQASIVAEKATVQATIVAEKAAQARAMAEQQANELAASVKKTMEEKPAVAAAKITLPAAALPWESAHPERRAEARERVLKLSMDDHTFTIPPPKEANFVYDAVSREPFAARMLDTDALLSAKRFKLVPKTVDETEFWRNYFYRVDLILNAMGVPPPQMEQAKTDSKMESSGAQHEGQHDAGPDWEEEMRKQIAAAEASNLDDAVKDDENFDMLEDDLEFEDDGELETSIKDLKL